MFCGTLDDNRIRRGLMQKTVTAQTNIKNFFQLGRYLKIQRLSIKLIQQIKAYNHENILSQTSQIVQEQYERVMVTYE